jgi:ribosomal protein S18 acetylase RimI-like enzyme
LDEAEVVEFYVVKVPSGPLFHKSSLLSRQQDKTVRRRRLAFRGMVVVRERTADDVDACVDVLHKVHANEGYPRGTNDLRSFITHPGIRKAWVAIKEEEVVGHLAISEPLPKDLAIMKWREQHPGEVSVALVQRLYVLPAARKNGVAVSLLEAAVSHAHSVNLRLVLFVLLANEGAIRLYRRLGWEVYGNDIFRFGETQEQEMGAICFASPVK